MADKPKTKTDAIRVVALVAIIASDGDLILSGTPGTLLRWEAGNGRDSVVVAWDAYLFVGTDQCCSRHCRLDGGYEWAVDIHAIRYMGAGEWTDKPEGPADAP